MRLHQLHERGVRPCTFANDQNDRNAKLFDGSSSDSTISTISKDDSGSLASTSVLNDELSNESRNVHEGARWMVDKRTREERDLKLEDLFIY